MNIWNGAIKIAKYYQPPNFIRNTTEYVSGNVSRFLQPSNAIKYVRVYVSRSLEIDILEGQQK
jgi:hypothetical protein